MQSFNQNRDFSLLENFNTQKFQAQINTNVFAIKSLAPFLFEFSARQDTDWEISGVVAIDVVVWKLRPTEVKGKFKNSTPLKIEIQFS